MLSEPVGNLLQLLALAMEFVGISLAMIELRFPAIAAAIMRNHASMRAHTDIPDNTIGGSDAWLDMSLQDFYLGKSMNVASTTPLAALTRMVISVVAFFVMLLLIFWALGGSEALFALSPLNLAYMAAVPLTAIVITPLTVYLCARIVVFTRTFSAGRGIGTLGLLLAFTGLLLELYQVITVMVSDQPAISEAPAWLQVIVATAGFILLIFSIYIVSVIRRVGSGVR